MLGLKLIHVNKWGSWSIPAAALEGGEFIFTAANDKRYLTLYKLVISITIIIIVIIDKI